MDYEFAMELLNYEFVLLDDKSPMITSINYDDKISIIKEHNEYIRQCF